jgi:hypothetical protein
MASSAKKRLPRRQLNLSEVVGWYGMLAIIGAYGLVSFEAVGADSIIYQGLNFSGALGLLWIAFRKNVTQLVVLNTFWALIAVLSLGNLFL